MNINFRTLQDEKELRRLIDFMARQDLKYPRYDAWIQRAQGELEQGYKRALLAVEDSRVVADVVTQTHKSVPEFLEIKNFRVDESVRTRYFGKFMNRQIEHEARGRYDAIVCDVRVDQREVLDFFLSCGYRPVMSAPLYDSAVEEVLLMKVLNEKARERSLFRFQNFGVEKAQ